MRSNFVLDRFRGCGFLSRFGNGCSILVCGAADDPKVKKPWPGSQGVRHNSSGLKQIPQELVIDLVVKLDFLRFYERSQSAGAAVGGGLFQIRVTALHIFA